ncbi:MAG: hypothetical protein ACPG4U_09040 [Pseudomonadales bacterium]
MKKAPFLIQILIVCGALLPFEFTLAEEEEYTPLTFTPSGQNFILQGVIDDYSLEDFEHALKEHPKIRHLIFENVPGSIDDETNLQLAKRIHSLGFTTAIPAGGLIASGGTDLFLAGVRRSIAEHSCVGVHAWAAETDDGLIDANQVPRDAAEHKAYTDYYRTVNIDPEFYWYTLAAATSEQMHWMSYADVRRFRLGDNYQLNDTGRAIDCDAIPDP